MHELAGASPVASHIGVSNSSSSLDLSVLDEKMRVLMKTDKLTQYVASRLIVIIDLMQSNISAHICKLVAIG